jgi:Fe-S-cluster containining protein
MELQDNTIRTRETIFLTRRETLRAIEIDFQQYRPQLRIWREITPMIMGKATHVIEDFDARRLWLVSGRRRRIRSITAKELGDHLVRGLERSALSLERLALICERIFQTNVWSGALNDGKKKGLCIETGMEEFECKKCGKCCQTLDYHDQLSERDYRFWQELGRRDLLKWVRRVQKNRHEFFYRIWVPPGALAVSDSCPWLSPIKTKTKTLWQCSIHSVKPEICRQYPGTRKHAVMTGCPGFSFR